MMKDNAVIFSIDTAVVITCRHSIGTKVICIFVSENLTQNIGFYSGTHKKELISRKEILKCHINMYVYE